jgi:hypothetical protein
MDRVRKVQEFRERSTAAPTRAAAMTPKDFFYVNQPSARYLIIPEVSSEKRRYVPMGVVGPELISANTNFLVPSDDPFLFGVLTSAMHMAWLRTVGGRLKSDVRYSGSMVYNTFPWPTDLEDKRKTAVETAAQAVLDARLPFLPPLGDSTLADLYDPLTMPAPLAKAHAALDKAVDRCYRKDEFKSDRERVEHLFARYESLTAPLLPPTPKQRKSRGETKRRAG